VQLACCRKCFFTFSLGTAVIFPLCLFSELMIGLHKIYVKNYIDTVSRLCELIGFLVILKTGGGLFEIVVYDVVLMGTERCFTGFCVSRFIPGFRLRFHLFDRKVFREVFGFSSGTYFMSLARLLRVQTRNPIISKYRGLDFVGIFNISSRLSDLCNQAIAQYNDNVRPVTTQLYHRGRFRMLGDFIVKSMQWNMFMCCLIIVPAIMLRDEAILALFKKDVTPMIHALSLLSLLGIFVWLVVTQIPNSVLLMCEKHHMLAIVSMIEAVVVVTLNILFLRSGYSIVCIEIISISVSLFLFATIKYPVMQKIIHGKAIRDLFRIYVPSLLAAVPPVAVLLLCKRLLLGRVHEFLLCAVCGTAYAVVYVLISWQFLIGRTKKELWKRRVMIRVQKYLKKD
jgi:O-antigen/teichoic acid export membrane protein